MKFRTRKKILEKIRCRMYVAESMMEFMKTFSEKYPDVDIYNQEYLKWKIVYEEMKSLYEEATDIRSLIEQIIELK